MPGPTHALRIISSRGANYSGCQRVGRPIVRAYGYLDGVILRLGPSYSSWVGSVRAHQNWLSCWEHYYPQAEDLGALGQIHERYSEKIMGYKDRDVARICEIPDPGVVAWAIDAASDTACEILRDTPEYSASYSDMWKVSALDSPGEPRMFLGTRHALGLVPSGARIGDHIVRFWNCDAAILVRPVKGEFGCGQDGPAFMMVGRADVAEGVERSNTPGLDEYGEQGLLGRVLADGERGSPGAMCVDLSLCTLQMISASIKT